MWCFSLTVECGESYSASVAQYFKIESVCLSSIQCYWFIVNLGEPTLAKRAFAIYVSISLVPGVHGQVERTSGLSRLRMCKIFPRNLGNHVILVFFCEWNTHNRVFYSILLRNGHLQWQRQRVLISLGLAHILDRRRIQCLEAMDKWPCGDCFTFYSAMLCDDVLIENNKYATSLCKIMEQWK